MRWRRRRQERLVRAAGEGRVRTYVMRVRLMPVERAWLDMLADEGKTSTAEIVGAVVGRAHNQDMQDLRELEARAQGGADVA